MRLVNINDKVYTRPECPDKYFSSLLWISFDLSVSTSIVVVEVSLFCVLALLEEEEEEEFDCLSLCRMFKYDSEQLLDLLF